ncbi:hypothetical protein [Kibdelosporangium aridum]
MADEDEQPDQADAATTAARIRRFATEVLRICHRAGPRQEPQADEERDR